MSERVVKINLSEVQTVRVRCQSPHCGGVVVELPLSELPRRYGGLNCPLCNASFDLNKSGDVILAEFGRAAERLKAMFPVVQVELVLPETPGTGAP